MSNSSDPKPKMKGAGEQSTQPEKRRSQKRSRRRAHKVKPSLKKKSKHRGLVFSLLALVVLAGACVGYLKLFPKKPETLNSQSARSKADEQEKLQTEIDYNFGRILHTNTLLKQNPPRNQKRGLQDERMKAAEKLLELELSNDEKFVASREYINALLEMHSNGFFVDAKIRLQLFCDELLDGGDPSLIQLAKFGLTRLSLVDFLRQPDSDFAPTYQAVNNLIDEYDKNEFLANEMVKIVQQLINFDHEKEAIQLVDYLVTKYPTDSGDEENKLCLTRRQLVDLKNLTVSKFSDSVMAVLKDEDQATSKLVAIVESLCDEKTISTGVLKNISRSVRFLEGHHKYDAITRINVVLRSKLSDHPDELIAGFIKEEIDMVEKRISWVGREFEVSVDDTEDENIIDELKGYVTAVVFWSAEDTPATLATMSGINMFYKANRDKGIEFQIVCINIDDDAKKARSIVESDKLPYRCIFQDSSKTEDVTLLREKYGLVFAPYVMLLDRNGRVAHVNMLPENMVQEVNKLLETDAGE